MVIILTVVLLRLFMHQILGELPLLRFSVSSVTAETVEVLKLIFVSKLRDAGLHLAYPSKPGA